MKRKVKMISALVVAVAIALTGTLAWHKVISKANEFIGETKDVTVHDDFDPDDGQKDIYVENRGNTTLFVRVKLDEAMSLTDHTWRPGPGDWESHIYGSQAEDCGKGNSANKLFHDYFKWTMGGWKYYMPGSGTNGVMQDTNQYNGSEPGVKQTPDAQIITVADFLAMTDVEQKAFIGWIYDTDGYAYWSQPLQPGDVTGLLLHGVATDPSLKGTEYYYVINAIVEVVDSSDIPMWTQGAPSVDNSNATQQEATTDGKTVINIIAGGNTNPPTTNPIPATDVKINGGDVQIDLGGQYTPTIDITPPNSTDKPVWTTSDANVATVDPNTGEITGVGEGQAVITVTVGGVTDSITVTVVDPTPGPKLKPTDPVTGYTPRTDEGGWWTGFDWDLPNAPHKSRLDRAGAFRLEDILEGNDYSNLTVESLDPRYPSNLFSIGNATFVNGNPLSILYNLVPLYDDAKKAYFDGNWDKYPVPLMLRLTQNGKSVDFLATMEFHSVNVSFE